MFKIIRLRPQLSVLKQKVNTDDLCQGLPGCSLSRSAIDSFWEVIKLIIFLFKLDFFNIRFFSGPFLP